MVKRDGAKWGIIGVILGALAGLLFAPKAGKETRQDIKQGAKKAKIEAEKKLSQAKAEAAKRTNQAKSTAKTYAVKTRRAAKRAAADVKDEFSK